MKKKITALLLGLVLLCASLGLKVWADDANADSINGDWGAGNKNNKWTGYEGVRVTLVDANTGTPVSEPFDWSNFKTDGLEIYHGGKKSKMHYLAGENFKLDFDYDYDCANSHSEGMPSIIGGMGGANLSRIKNFFLGDLPKAFIIQKVNETSGLGVTLEDLKEERYHVIVEPVAFFYFDGILYALTATECALYDKQVGGDLHNMWLKNLTQRNLPASLFLVEEIYRGTPYHILPWNGGLQYYDNDVVTKYLGVGQFSFSDTPSVPGNPDYIYRTNTEVVTAVTVSASGDITPDDGAVVTFDIPGVGSKDFSLAAVPGGGSQVCWVTWTTPSDPASMPIGVTSTHGTPDKTSINAEIIKLEEQTPPNPLGTDKSNGFVLSGPPADNHEPDGYTSPETAESRTWTVWSAKEVEKEDGTKEWKFTSADYTASLSPGGVSVKPADSVPTAKQSGGGWTMKSGYGISATVTPTVTGLSYDGVTSAQTAIATFPEFDYEEYDRILEKSNGSFTFRVNPYSMRGDPIHFTPVWYPDKTAYPVHFELRDAWTPAGELRVWVTSSGLTIQGSVYDDWYVQRGD